MGSLFETKLFHFSLRFLLLFFYFFFLILPSFLSSLPSQVYPTWPQRKFDHLFNYIVENSFRDH